MSQLKKAIERVKKDSKGASDDSSRKLLQQVAESAARESNRTIDDIYNEVVFDEINDELMKAVQKAEGETVVMLLRQERVASFEKLWRQTNLDFYQTQANKQLSKRLKDKEQQKQPDEQQ